MIAVAVVGAVVAVFVFWPKGEGIKVEGVPIALTNIKEAKEHYAQAVKLRQMNEPLQAKAVYQEIIKRIIPIL